MNERIAALIAQWRTYADDLSLVEPRSRTNQIAITMLRQCADELEAALQDAAACVEPEPAREQLSEDGIELEWRPEDVAELRAEFEEWLKGREVPQAVLKMLLPWKVEAEAATRLRYFRPVDGFADGTQHIRMEADGRAFLVRADGSETVASYSREDCLEKVQRGVWEEVQRGMWEEFQGAEAAAPRPIAEDDLARCAICGWLLAESLETGCVRGNCSQRPLPTRYYSSARAKQEYGLLWLPRERPPSAVEQQIASLTAERDQWRQWYEALMATRMTGPEHRAEAAEARAAHLEVERDTWKALCRSFMKGGQMIDNIHLELAQQANDLKAELNLANAASGIATCSACGTAMTHLDFWRCPVDPRHGDRLWPD